MKTNLNIFSLFCLVIFLANCGGPATGPAKFSNDEMDTQNAAWAEMMEYHDIVMEKMGQFYPLTKGLEALAEETAVQATDIHPRAKTAIVELEKAEDGMMEWMQGIGANPLDSIRAKNDHAGVLSMIEEELNNIEQVNDAMDKAIEEAKTLIEEN